MSLAVVYARALVGVSAPLVTVEVHVANGLPSLAIVGLAETSVKESKDRVRSALMSAGFEFPAQRITVNLAPADLPKEGGRYDLAIAIGILMASGQLQGEHIERYEFTGELALTGAVRAVSGSLAAAQQAALSGRALWLAGEQAQQLAALTEAELLPADHLLTVCAHLAGRDVQAPAQPQALTLPSEHYSVDMAEIKGQHMAKRALVVAAAGGHNILFCGPPGTGKSMLAERLPSIMPPLTAAEAFEIALIQSITGGDVLRLARPFRQPHHSASAAALVGGGSQPRPGEISLAHQGVLFLDELPEFPRQVLEVLREPLEKGEIAISRSKAQLTFPAKFQLVAAMNPCPCGYAGDSRQQCRCNPEQIRRYRDKISGPLLDRIDLQVWVAPLARGELFADSQGTTSSEYRQSICAVRERQLARQGKPNSHLSSAEIKRVAGMSGEQQQWLEAALERMKLSARAAVRVLRVARTLADLAGSERVREQDLQEALGYRQLDRAP